MPRPSDMVVTIPPDELRVVLSPSNEMTMWVPAFAEQPEATICHADGTVLCRGGPDYHKDLQLAYAAYQERMLKSKSPPGAVSAEPVRHHKTERAVEPQPRSAQ